MTERDDPQRWLHGAADAPARFAALARADEAAGPNAAQLARMLDGIAVQVGQPELSMPLHGAAQSGFGISWTRWAPYAAGIGAVVLIAIGVLVGREDGARRAEKAGAAAKVAVKVPGTAVSKTETETEAETGAETGAETETGTETGSAGVVTKSVVTRTSAVPAGRKLGARESGDPVAELALLERAQRVLRSDPGAALALAETHRAQFARGVLAQEREVLAVEALLRLGRRSAAQRRALAFAQRYPESSHLVRVHDLLRSIP